MPPEPPFTVAVYVVPAASGASGRRVTAESLVETGAATKLPLASRSLKLLRLTVAGSIVSLKVAVTEAPGSTPVVPSAGIPFETVGGVVSSGALPTPTMRATDGTPFESTMKSMYTPGGATLAFDGAVAVRLVAPALNDSGT